MIDTLGGFYLQPILDLGGYTCLTCGAWVVNGTVHFCFQYATSPPFLYLIPAAAPCPSCGYCPTCGSKNTEQSESKESRL